MKSDRPPFFRKQYIPWYDTTAVCRIMMGILMLVFLFALTGVTVAWSEPDLVEHVWFPGMLGGLCLFLIVKIGSRLWRRNGKE
ncbi:MAG: hypothetical protein ACQEQ5_08125 [Thermodesulfobacteriota bacterium]